MKELWSSTQMIISNKLYLMEYKSIHNKQNLSVARHLNCSLVLILVSQKILSASRSNNMCVSPGHFWHSSPSIEGNRHLHNGSTNNRNWLILCRSQGVRTHKILFSTRIQILYIHISIYICTHMIMTYKVIYGYSQHTLFRSVLYT